VGHLKVLLRNAYRILAVKLQKNRPLGIFRRRLKDENEIDHRQIGYKDVEFNWSFSQGLRTLLHGVRIGWLVGWLVS